MRRNFRQSLVLSLPAALLLAFAAPLLAAGDPLVVREPSPAKSVVLRASSANSANSANSEAPASGQVVFQVLLAEIALQRGDLDLASKAWADLARRTRDPRAIERAVEVAGYSRRFDLALESARLWLEVEPESARAQQMLAGVLIIGNRFDELAPLMARLLAAEPEGLAGNLLGLNRMLARNTDRAAVLRLVDLLTEPYLQVAEAHYARAVAASSAAAPARALAEARRALELRPDWEPAALLEAQLLARDSNAEAVVALDRFVARNPGARDVRLHLARALIGEARYGEARAHFDRLLKEAPNSQEIIFPAAILALQQNDAARADTLLRQLLTLDFPDPGVARYYLGQIAEQRQRVDEAIGFYAAVGAGDQYLPAQLRVARLLADRGEVDTALVRLREAKPRNAQEKSQLIAAEAQLLRDAKRPREAFALLSNELARQPADPELLYETALLAEKIDRVDLLEKHLRRLIELKPDSAQAYNALGYSYADRNIHLPEARTLIEKALSLLPDDPFVLDSLGWVLYRQGDLAGAREKLERAYSLRNDPEIAAHLGEVLWMQDRHDEARLLWRDAASRSPGNEVLADALKRFVP
jgi:tetratricopeptide (TPR) repeat protein